MADLPVSIGDPGTNYGPLALTGPGTDDTVTLSIPDTLPDTAFGSRRTNRVVEIACATAITVAGAAGDIAANRGTPVAAGEKYPVLFNRNGQQVFIQGTAAANVSVRVRS